jgi:organic hydroperoxide reductase OsmC/OhrA
MTASLNAGTSVVAGRASDDDHDFAFDLRLDDGYAHRIDFGLGGVDPLIVDEAPPLGAARGPNPARLLGAAVASCLASSLLFCLRKSRIEVKALRTRVSGRVERNERGRYRVSEIRVELSPEISEDDRARMSRCAEIFEDFCIVTQSVRSGVPVSVTLTPSGRG